MEIRDRIHLVIDKKGLSVREVSLAAGMSDSMLHKYLTGRTRSITIDNLEAVAKALGVSLHYLTTGEERYEEVAVLWERISERDRNRARRILEGFADDSTGTDG